MMYIFLNIKKFFSSKTGGKILLIIGLSVFLFAISASITNAIDPTPTPVAPPAVTTPTFVGSCTNDGALGILCGMSVALQSLILGLLSALKALFGWILSSMTALTIWAIGSLGIYITTHEAVSVGFKISLNIANVVFVIAIIMIAFATIVRWHEYEAKKLLPKLIITALLVNFSLLAAGLMLDVSNVFTKFFLREDVVNAESIGAALSPQAFGAPAIYGAVADINTFLDRYDGAVDSRGVFSFLESYSKESIRRNLGVSKEEFEAMRSETGSPRLLALLQKNGHKLKTNWFESTIGFESAIGADIDIGDLWAQFLDVLPRVIFSLLATFIAMLTMIAMFIMALIRNIWVIVLLIVMPLAWGLRVLPKFEQYWQKWWEKFLNWGILYLPTVAFFIFLAVTTTQTTRVRLEEGSGVSTFGKIDGISETTAGFLGSGGTAPPLITSFVMMLIVIGLMIAGLKVAQSMGSAVAGAFAGIAGASGRKLAGGILKTGTAGTGKLVGLALSPLGLFKGIGAGKRYDESEEGVAARAKIDKAKRAGNLNRAAAKLEKEYQTNRRKSIRGELLSGMEAFSNGNLYGKGTELLSRGFAAASFIPGFGAVAQFLGKTSAAQGEAIEKAKAEYEGLSTAARQAKYNSPLKSQAEKAAAVAVAHEKDEMDKLPHDMLGSLANAVASFNPGVERKKIDLLKAMAGHDPMNSKAISGEETGAVVRRLDTGAIQSLGEEVYDQIKGHMSTSQRRAWAGRDGGAQNKVLAEEIAGLTGALHHLPQNMQDDFRKAMAAGGHKDQALMKQVAGHLEKIAADKALVKKINSVTGAVQSLQNSRDVARNTTLRTKSKSEHGPKVDGSWSPGALLWKFLKSGGGGGSSGGGRSSAPKAASGGHGH